MPTFSFMKQTRMELKERKAMQAEKAKEEPPKKPYKHVPTHAAVDAIATAPASWKHDDRPRIMEQNKRRSAMAAGGMNLGGLPRVGSSLSYVSFPSAYATPVVSRPKNYSYSSIPSSFRESVANTHGDGDYLSQPVSVKGKERAVGPRFTIGTETPLMSSGRASPVLNRGIHASVSVAGGSGGSGGTDDEQEMRRKALKRAASAADNQILPLPKVSSCNESCHRLHPSRSRSNSETPTVEASDRHYPPPAKSTFYATPRPLSGRALTLDMIVPPVLASPDQPGVSPSSSSASGRVSTASSTASIGVANSTAPSSASSLRAPSITDEYQAPAQNQQPRVYSIHPPQRQTVRRVSMERKRASADTVVLISGGTDMQSPQAQQPQLPQSPQVPQKSRRRLSKSRPPSFVGTEPPPSADESPVRPSAEMERAKVPSASATEAMIRELNKMNEATAHPAVEAETAPAPEVHRRKLSKKPKVVNLDESRRRWSFRTSKIFFTS
ncbi:Uu.00g043700.m01.CDS01 [Anthostomella pinea]|uniref:Uu.00g043700.m01.CDS01 n=1 Tax=Anthostomella pinea TaxID=933095 RepID=A0AAI8VBB4_9PEZI|nr:Uu.00g043700.m01.CDS01 [Anthostomella pinea]